MFLLENGAKIGALDAHGWGCRQVAELDGHSDFAEMIVRYQMTDKQSSMRKLPDLEYHGELWTDLVDSYADKKYQHNRALQQEQRVLGDIEQAKRNIKTNYMIHHLIDDNRTTHASTDLQGVSDSFYLRHKGVEKPRDKAYEVGSGSKSVSVSGSASSSMPVTARSRKASSQGQGLELGLYATTSTTNSASVSRRTTPRIGSGSQNDSGASTPATNTTTTNIYTRNTPTSSSSGTGGIGFTNNLRKSSSGRNVISSAGRNTLA